MNRVYNCASYSRLSKDDIGKIDESSSIGSQKMIISSFAKFNNLNIVKEYVDDGYSGGNFDRPAFGEMLKDIEKGTINCVITKDLSRLGREIYKTGNYIEQYFTERNIRYIAINDSFDSNIGDTMLGLRLGVNDLYLRDVSKKVKSSFRVKQEKGLYLGSFACYGYKKDPNDRHRLIIDEEVVDIVKSMFTMTLEGKSPSYIADYLTDRKIPIPVVYKKDPRGLKIIDNEGRGIWRRQTVKDILQSKMYIGHMVQNKFNKISYNSKKLREVDPVNYIVVENTHEAIIDEETFERVGEMLNNRKKEVKHGKKKYLLSGLLKCSDCGCGLSINEKKNKSGITRFVQCNTYLKKGKYGICSTKRLNYDWIEEDVITYLKSLCEKILKLYDSDNLIEKINTELNKKDEEITIKIKRLEQEQKKVRKVMDNLYDDKVEGLINDDTFKYMFQKNEIEIEIINQKLEELRNLKEETDIRNSVTEYEKLKIDIEKYLQMKKPNHTIMNKLIEKIVVNKEKEIDVYFRFKGISSILKE